MDLQSHHKNLIVEGDVSRYRGRKSFPMINVLVACTFDLKLTYILSEWEGSTSNSIILDSVWILPEGGGGEMNIDDIYEVEANNKIHLENFNLYDCESALSTPRTRGLLSSTL
jgi:hypothetical protein